MKKTGCRVTAEDYARAERFLPHNVQKVIYRTSVAPQWIEGKSIFWYRVHTPEGKRFYRVDPEEERRENAFDHHELAAALSRATGRAYEPGDLPFDEFYYVSEGEAIEFAAGDYLWHCDLQSYQCRKKRKHHDAESISPDRRWAAFLRGSNLWVRDLETEEEFPLTGDGEEHFGYGMRPGARLSAVTEKLQGERRPPALLWSPDSRRILTHQLDEREVHETTLLQSVPPEGSRPIPHSYRYPLPGDEHVAVAHLAVLNVPTGEMTRLDVPPLPSIVSTPAEAGLAWWDREGEQVHVIYLERGFRRASLIAVDPLENRGTTLVREESEKGHAAPFFSMVDSPAAAVLDGGEAIWFSMRDGWGHLYLFDGDSECPSRQITRGAYSVREILRVDEKNRVIYFTGGSREEDEDPYYLHLYRVDIDGGEPTRLTPDNAHHRVHVSPDARYFVETASRVDLAPRTVVRDVEGVEKMELEVAELEQLQNAGYRPPERFSVKARDGTTDLFGVIYHPTDFDPEEQYPVIDSIYPGPQVIRTPKGFSADEREVHRFWEPQAVAELGFVVVTIDGLGTPHRSRSFLEAACGRDFGEAGGLEDHVTGIRQLADNRPYMDLNRVGIYGHSGGGYASTRAMLKFPDFYKVAVSSAGNHDQRGYQALWGELWIGLIEGDNYDHQANVDLVDQLAGKLLLVHGDLDDNVHPALTMQLVHALIEADKDFDMLMLPGRNHLLQDLTRPGGEKEKSIRFDPYFTRRMWDYFVGHLKGAEPPEYRLNPSKG